MEKKGGQRGGGRKGKGRRREGIREMEGRRGEERGGRWGKEGGRVLSTVNTLHHMVISYLKYCASSAELGIDWTNRNSSMFRGSLGSRCASSACMCVCVCVCVCVCTGYVCCVCGCVCVCEYVCRCVCVYMYVCMEMR